LTTGGNGWGITWFHKIKQRGRSRGKQKKNGISRMLQTIWTGKLNLKHDGLNPTQDWQKKKKGGTGGKNNYRKGDLFEPLCRKTEGKEKRGKKERVKPVKGKDLAMKVRVERSGLIQKKKKSWGCEKGVYRGTGAGGNETLDLHARADPNSGC